MHVIPFSYPLDPRKVCGSVPTSRAIVEKLFESESVISYHVHADQQRSTDTNVIILAVMRKKGERVVAAPMTSWDKSWQPRLASANGVTS